VNPALTANINADWRVIANFRDQWIGPASPYATGTISYDRKILQNKMPGVEEDKNTFGFGAMLMYDYAMSGVVKSTYASLNVSYNLQLAEGTYLHRLGAGFGAIYGRRYIDFGRVDFEEQFTGTGFNVNLPTGEMALSNMKPYISSSAGITYSITSEKSNIDIGISAFHLNKPKQTFLEDEHQILPMRKVGHINFETFLNDYLLFNANAIYQFQDDASYYSFGGAFGYIIPTNNDFILNAGLWYWSKNAVIPYVGLVYDNKQFGFSYDYTISKLNIAPRKPHTWEVSFIIRGVTGPRKTIPCPWK
jgi:type IX secretion system PorP/SprF family membrane protein